MFRRDVYNYKEYIECPNKYDYTQFLAASFHGECVYIPSASCCYRKTEGSSIMSRTVEVEQGLYQAFKFFVEKFFEGKCLVKCSLWDNKRIYVNMLINGFINKDCKLLSIVIRQVPFSVFLLPEAFTYSTLRTLKRYLFGYLD